MKEYEVYTDGSCKGNEIDARDGGWAYVIRKFNKNNNKWDREWHRADCTEKTTNNQMEMTAVIEALKKCDEIYEKSRSRDTVFVYSDSAYVINCYAQGWYRKWEKNGWLNSKNKPVKNRELWEQLIPYFRNPRYKFKKIKGHAGEVYNEVVDFLAQRAAEQKIGTSKTYEGQQKWERVILDGTCNDSL